MVAFKTLFVSVWHMSERAAVCFVCSVSVFSVIKVHQQGPNSNPHQMWTAPKPKTQTFCRRTNAQTAPIYISSLGFSK